MVVVFRTFILPLQTKRLFRFAALKDSEGRQYCSLASLQIRTPPEFLRRVCPDLTGALPPPERVREFVGSKDRQKRQKVVEVLLNTPEFVDYWTYRFANVFRVARYANQINPRSAQAYFEWIRASIAANKPYDQIARERIAARGYGGAAPHYFPAGEERNPEQKMGEQVRVFLGRRFDCAQCHNHPFEAWSQDQFWGLTAFFGRMNAVKFGPQDSNLHGSVLYDDPAGQEVDYGQTGKEQVCDASADQSGGSANFPRRPTVAGVRAGGPALGTGRVDDLASLTSPRPPSTACGGTSSAGGSSIPWMIFAPRIRQPIRTF